MLNLIILTPTFIINHLKARLKIKCHDFLQVRQLSLYTLEYGFLYIPIFFLVGPVYTCCYDMIINNALFKSQTCYFTLSYSYSLVFLSFLSTGVTLLKKKMCIFSFYPDCSWYDSLYPLLAPILKVLLLWPYGGICTPNCRFLVKPTICFLGSIPCLADTFSCLSGFLRL